MSTNIVHFTGGCTNVAVVGASLPRDRQWLVGSVSDDPYDIRTRVIVDKQPGGLKYVATELQPISDVGMAERGYVVNEEERARGVNEAGFGFTWAFAQEEDTTPSADGLSSGEFARQVLSNCTSVEEALCLVESAPRAFSGSWFFVDAGGELAQVEIARRTYCVTKRLSAEEGGLAVNVNCFQDLRACQHQSGSMDLDDVPNAGRYNAARARLVGIEGRATLADIALVLSDHEGIETAVAEPPWVFPGQGFSVCNHGTFGDDSPTPSRVPFGTVSAEIIDPVSRTLWYCYGWPCGTSPSFRDQLYQDRSWGRFLPFNVDSLPLGGYTTLYGELTPLAVRHVDLRRVLEVASRPAVPSVRGR